LTANKKYALKEIAEMLSLKGREAESLYSDANTLTEELFGKSVYVRGIIEFSNICAKDCLYCGIRKGNGNVERYRMKNEEIIQTAVDAHNDGFKTIVLQSGEIGAYDDDITEIVEGIKERCSVAVTLSVGEKPKERYAEWKRAGADRYLLRIETTNRRLFETLHPDDDYDSRMKSLFYLKELGYETGTGVMIGLPGQTYSDLASDILFFRENDFDMLGVGPFIPHRDTPLGGVRPVSMEAVLNFLSAMRLATFDTNIPATTSMATLDREGREKALNAGANVIMPNYTPQKYRESYKLYDNKVCTRENAEETMEFTKSTVERAGKVLVMERGDRRIKQ